MSKTSANRDDYRIIARARTSAWRAKSVLANDAPPHRSLRFNHSRRIQCEWTRSRFILAHAMFCRRFRELQSVAPMLAEEPQPLSCKRFSTRSRPMREVFACLIEARDLARRNRIFLGTSRHYSVATTRVRRALALKSAANRATRLRESQRAQMPRRCFNASLTA